MVIPLVTFVTTALSPNPGQKNMDENSIGDACDQLFLMFGIEDLEERLELIENLLNRRRGR